MPLTCALELARPADAARIALLSRNLIEHGLPWAWTPGRVKRCIAARDYVVLAARLPGLVCGFAVMQYLDRHAHLCLLGVSPDYRRRGIGRNMLLWLEKTARVAGTFQVVLEVREFNQGAVVFYEKLDYEQSRLLPSYYAPTENAIRMTRDLTIKALP